MILFVSFVSQFVWYISINIGTHIVGFQEHTGTIRQVTTSSIIHTIFQHSMTRARNGGSTKHRYPNVRRSSIFHSPIQRFHLTIFVNVSGLKHGKSVDGNDNIVAWIPLVKISRMSISLLGIFPIGIGNLVFSPTQSDRWSSLSISHEMISTSLMIILHSETELARDWS